MRPDTTTRMRRAASSKGRGSRRTSSEGVKGEEEGVERKKQKQNSREFTERANQTTIAVPIQNQSKS